MKVGITVLLLLLTLAIVALTTVDAKNCRKDDSKGKGKKCTKTKKGDRNKKVGRAKGKNKGKKSPGPPFWRKGPPKTNEEIVREGTRVTLSCAIKGVPRPSFSWLRNGRSLTSRTSKKIRLRRHRLTIQKVLIEDTGTYTCIAKNEHGSLNFTYSLRILENIRFKSLEVEDKPENQTSHVGDTAIFLCRSQDWPAPKVHWTRQTRGSHIIETVTSSDKNSDDSVLVIHNVTKKDSGIYTCFIGNNQVHKQLSATLTVIEENERLPFEPQCSLHVRRQVLVDNEQGCRSSEPVEMHYCMGSCGRSYYIPQMMTDDSKNLYHLNQTCSCCVGLVESLRIVELECTLGQKKRGFYTLLRGCQCQSCKVKDDHESSTQSSTNTTIKKSTATTTTATTSGAKVTSPP